MNRYKFITVDGEKLMESFRVFSMDFNYEIEIKNGREYVKVFMHKR